MNKLKPCPFCAVDDIRIDDEFKYNLYCDFCAASGPLCDDLASAIDKWNKRVCEE